jgi:hypothetical protein
MTENELSEYKRHPVVFLQHKQKAWRHSVDGVVIG